MTGAIARLVAQFALDLRVKAMTTAAVVGLALKKPSVASTRVKKNPLYELCKLK